MGLQYRPVDRAGDLPQIMWLKIPDIADADMDEGQFICAIGYEEKVSIGDHGTVLCEYDAQRPDFSYKGIVVGKRPDLRHQVHGIVILVQLGINGALIRVQRSLFRLLVQVVKKDRLHYSSSINIYNNIYIYHINTMP